MVGETTDRLKETHSRETAYEKSELTFIFDNNRILSEKKGKDAVLRKERWGG